MNKHQEGTNRGRTVAGHRVGFVMDWAWDRNSESGIRGNIWQVAKESANHRAGQEAGLEPWEHIGKHWAWKQDRTQQDIFKVCKLDIVVLGHWGMDWTGWQDRFIGGIGLAYKTLSRFEKVKKTRIVFFFPPYSLS